MPAHKVLIDAAVSIRIGEDGTVYWTAGRIVEGEFGPEVVPTNDGTEDSALLHESAALATPAGCEEPFGDVNIDSDGLGLTSCTFEAYAQLENHFAPRIYLDEDGLVVKIADRYHA